MLEALRRQLADKGELRLRVKVTPKSGRSEITGFLDDGTMKVRLRAAPERGKANDELCLLLATGLGVHPARVSVTAGATSPRKTVLIRS